MVTIPAAVNYPQQWTSNPSKLRQQPIEGDREISFEIPWAAMGGSNNAVGFNVGSGSVAPITQISSLAVDNSDCGMDVRFIFPDTGYTVTIPAGALNVIIPVFTNATQFICVATINNEAEEPLDVTRFVVLNFVPPPIAVPPTTAQELGANSYTTLDGTASTALIPAASVYSSGSVTGLTMRYAGQATAGGVSSLKIVDGTGRQIAWAQMAAANATIYNVELLNLNPLDVRYSGGLFLEQSGTAIGGQVTINIPVKQP